LKYDKENILCKNEDSGITVLSLCDGMSCGHIALDKAGIKVKKYFASEIKEIGIKVTKDNYPDTVHIGDVNKITYENGVLHTEIGDFETEIDIVMFGSPCQTFSIACKTDKRIGLDDDMKSGLFFQCHRILNEINPKVFFMENVASMKNDDRDFITELMGIEPHKIDAKLVAPELRNRYYWTNLNPKENVSDKNILLQDILVDGYTDRDKARNLLVSDSRPLTTPVKMFHRYYSTGFTTLIFKSRQHYEECVNEYERLIDEKLSSVTENSGEYRKRALVAKDLDGYTGHTFDGVRYLYQEELEKCQCVPSGYTKCLNRNDAADVLGDGWNIDVIAHFFRNIQNYI
jgi:site-specific DNA-cytosine methylase